MRVLFVWSISGRSSYLPTAPISPRNTPRRRSTYADASEQRQPQEDTSITHRSHSVLSRATRHTQSHAHHQNTISSASPSIRSAATEQRVSHLTHTHRTTSLSSSPFSLSSRTRHRLPYHRPSAPPPPSPPLPHSPPFPREKPRLRSAPLATLSSRS